MSNEPIVTLVGNLVDDPILRFTPSGAAVANFTIAQTPRVKSGDEWVDGEAMFINCAVWRDYAENVAESLLKGMRVVAHGRLKTRSYETREGEKRTTLEMDVEEVGPSLRYATAQVTKTAPSQNSSASRTAARPAARPAARDPWATGSAEPPY